MRLKFDQGMTDRLLTAFNHLAGGPFEAWLLTLFDFNWHEVGCHVQIREFRFIAVLFHKWRMG